MDKYGDFIGLLPVIYAHRHWCVWSHYSDQELMYVEEEILEDTT